ARGLRTLALRRPAGDGARAGRRGARTAEGHDAAVPLRRRHFPDRFLLRRGPRSRGRAQDPRGALSMHSIERYAIVALLFLVVTVVAVLMWDGGKDKKKKEGVLGTGQVSAAEHPPLDPRPDPRDADRRMSLVADAQPGPLVRPQNRRRAGALAAQ